MKIVVKDNFARETVSEWVLAVGIPTRGYAEVMTKALNDRYGGEHSSFYAVAVEDDYVLYKFEP